MTVTLLGAIWALTTCDLPLLPEEGVEWEGRFSIRSVTIQATPFQKPIVYEGWLKKGWKRTPCRIYFPSRKERPPANGDFWVKGCLLAKGNRNYLLKPQEIKKVPSSYSFAETRFQWNNRLRCHLQSFFPDPKVSSFLLSMLTGETTERLLSLEFNRLGILHLIGISGFQFLILAALLGGLLRLIFPYTAASMATIGLLTLYTWILGSSPPIERAWITTTLCAIAPLCTTRITPLNSLGIALLWQLIYDPSIIFHLGFQFSFLCTAAILLVYPVVKEWFTHKIPNRSLGETLNMALTTQQGYILLLFGRESVAINATIHTVTLPLLFYHFHKFPCLSVLYNLFLPAAVSLLYLFLIFGLFLDLFGLGKFLHPITNSLSEATLYIATHPPALYDFQIRVPNCSLITTVVSITLICYWAFSLRSDKL